MADRFELPIAVFDSVLSISLRFNTTRQAVFFAVREHRKYCGKYFIEKVSVDDNNLEIA